MTEYSKKRPICELYACLQSEGKLTGVPHLLIRTTGCPLRCMFADTDFCDSSYTSWAPEKGEFSYDDVIKLIKENPQIKHTMITGGSPTMHEQMLVDLCDILKSYDHYITLETEGTKFIEANLDFVSLSPKMSNSTPRVGQLDPKGKIISQKVADSHDKKRCNHEAMKMLITHYPDYQLKPVISDPEDHVMSEVKELQKILNIPNNKVYLMPAGGTEEELQPKRAPLMEYAWKEGYNYTDRIHITAYGDKRGY